MIPHIIAIPRAKLAMFFKARLCQHQGATQGVASPPEEEVVFLFQTGRLDQKWLFPHGAWYKR
jgi:hypothetical protein